MRNRLQLNSIKMCNPDEKKYLYELKQLIHGSKDERIHKFIDKEEYLLQFIRGRKYNVESAFETLKYDYKIRHEKYPYIFENLRPSSLRHVFESGLFGVLKNRDNEGRVIAFCRLEKWEIRNISGLETQLAVQLLMKEIGLLMDTQMNGVTLIRDNQGSTSEHAKLDGLMESKRTIDLFHTHPFKVGAVFFINAPRLLEITFKVVKVFLSKKIRERVVFRSDCGHKDIHMKISPEILPKWLGGRLTDEEAMDMEIFQRIFDKEEFYANYNKIY